MLRMFMAICVGLCTASMLCADIIHLDGYLDEKALSAVEAAGQADIISFNSDGGELFTAMKIGRIIRAKKLSTTTHGPCASACPIAWLGGLNRTAKHPLGFHSIARSDGLAVPQTDPIYYYLTQYLLIMGANPTTVIGWIMTTPHETMAWPNEESLVGAGLLDDPNS